MIIRTELQESYKKSVVILNKNRVAYQMYRYFNDLVFQERIKRKPQFKKDELGFWWHLLHFKSVFKGDRDTLVGKAFECDFECSCYIRGIKGYGAFSVG
jgi:hypothetical protein